MQLNTTNVILTLLGITLVLCFVLTIMDKSYNNIEPFDTTVTPTNNPTPAVNSDPIIAAIQSQLQGETPDQLKSTIQALQQRLIDYGYAPDLNKYVTKTELGPNAGKCLVATAEDRDKYLSKSDVPAPGPRIDLSQYVKKSSVPPATVCPPAPEIDYSAYVKKSTLPPNEKCPPCIAPKVKVSAGLCRECPPPPACPVPEPCPQLRCPEPAPCPTMAKCTPCDEIRYIKVPTVITKTITLDSKGNVVSQNVDSGNVIPTQVQTTQANTIPQTTQANTFPQTTRPSQSLMNSIFGSTSVTQAALMNSTTFPNTTLAQTLSNVYNVSNVPNNRSFCPPPDLNSEFKSYGIYGR